MPKFLQDLGLFELFWGIDGKGPHITLGTPLSYMPWL